MATTQIKEPVAAHERLARLERTIATELPQELSRLAQQCGFSDVNVSFLKAVNSAAHGVGRKKAGRPKKAEAVLETRKRAVITTTGFLDAGHPTILAAGIRLQPTCGAHIDHAVDTTLIQLPIS